MPEPIIMTLSEFKDATTPDTLWKRGRDSYLRLVDLSLEKFDKFRHTQLLQDKKYHAFRITTNCQIWLTAKAGKSTSTASLRRPIVQQLGRQAWNFLQYWEFAARKAAKPGGFGNLQSLRPGYAAERSLYVASGKTQNPISGSYMHAASEDPKAADIIGTKSFSQLDDLDYQFLDAYLKGSVQEVDPMDPGSMAKTELPRAVLFLNKEERTKRLILIRDGLLWEGFDSKFDSAPFSRAFVIDKYGNLFGSNEIFDNSLSFNHSTFNAGMDVLCAGTITARQGQLLKIQNNSGHYKPTRDHLHNAVLLLNDQGLDLSAAKVIVGEPDPLRRGKMIEYDYDNAATFINNKNATPSRSVAEP
jgi:hypothetical protein